MSGKPLMTKYREELGLRLRDSRQKIFPTAKACAEKYSVSPSMWTEMEKGRVVFSPEKIIQLAEFLHVDAGWLLTGKSPETKKTSSPGEDEAKQHQFSKTTMELFEAAGYVSTLLHVMVAKHALGQVTEAALNDLMTNIISTIKKCPGGANLPATAKKSS